MVCNLNKEIISTSIAPPLSSDKDIDTDHSVLLIESVFEESHHFEWVRYKTRVITEEGKSRFTSFLTNINWEAEMSHSLCPSENTEIMHKKITTLNNICFPWKSRKVRSCDYPWITDNVRRAIRRRKRRYKKHKRDDGWKEIKSEIMGDIRKNKREYYDKEAEKAGRLGAPGIPFKILKHVTDPDKRSTWTVNELHLGQGDRELSNELAEFFSKITDCYTPLDLNNLPVTYSAPFNQVEPYEVAKRIKEGCKPLTAVDGDPIPSMITKTADILAIPATRIINLSFSTSTWPTPWKEETQSAIPKTTTPKSFNDLRNISCTNYISKVMESFLLDQLVSEVAVTDNQYGGQKGTGTTHYLIDTYQKVLDCLDDGISAMSLISINFSKAFNRMCHHICLEELSRRGASTESIAITASFLTGRSMRVKVGSEMSVPRQVRGADHHRGPKSAIICLQ